MNKPEGNVKAEETKGKLTAFTNPADDLVEDKPEVEKKTDDAILTTEEKQILFIQIASLHGGNAEATHGFGKTFIFGDEVTLPQVRGLITKYHDDILTATSAINMYVTDKFDCMSLLKRAEQINTGMDINSQLLTGLNKAIGKLDLGNNREDEKLSKLVLRNQQLANTFAKWDAERLKWMADANDTVTSIAYETTKKYGGEDQKAQLDVRKIANIMKRQGTEPFMADKMAGLLVANADQLFISEKEREATDRYMHDPEAVEQQPTPPPEGKYHDDDESETDEDG